MQHKIYNSYRTHLYCNLEFNCNTRVFEILFKQVNLSNKVIFSTNQAPRGQPYVVPEGLVVVLIPG